MYLHRTALESYIFLYRTALEPGFLYTCIEQLWSLESYIPVQNISGVLYIPVLNSSEVWSPIYLYRTALESGVINTCTEQLWSLESYIPVQNSWSLESYIPVQNSSGVWSPIYLYRTALESPEFTIQVLSNMKKAIRAVDPPVILYEPWTKYRLPTFIPSICSFSCLFLCLDCNLYFVQSKVLIQGKLFQRCMHFLHCSVLSLGGKVNTRRVSQPDIRDRN